MTERPWLRWVAVAMAMLVVVGGLALAGGFDEAERRTSRVPIGKALKTGRFTVTVHKVEWTDRTTTGDVQGDGDRTLLVEATVVNTSRETEYFTDQILNVSMDRRTTLKPTWWPGGVGYAHPGVPERTVQAFEVPRGQWRDAGMLIVTRENYGWNNLNDFGPRWSGGRYAWSTEIRPTKSDVVNPKL